MISVLNKKQNANFSSSPFFFIYSIYIYDMIYICQAAEVWYDHCVLTGTLQLCEGPDVDLGPLLALAQVVGGPEVHPVERVLQEAPQLELHGQLVLRHGDLHQLPQVLLLLLVEDGHLGDGVALRQGPSEGSRGVGDVAGEDVEGRWGQV